MWVKTGMFVMIFIIRRLAMVFLFFMIMIAFMMFFCLVIMMVVMSRHLELLDAMVCMDHPHFGISGGDFFQPGVLERDADGKINFDEFVKSRQTLTG